MLIGVFISTNVFAAAGYIAQGATITKISSTSNNVDAFWVYYTGASQDNCNGAVKFVATNAGTAGVFERSFSLAMTALVANKKIEIYSYTNTASCDSAVSINMSN